MSKFWPIQPVRHPNIVAVGVAIALSIGFNLFGRVSPTQAAEKVVLTYGLFGGSITIAELEAFTQTGKQTSTLNFLLQATEQESNQLRKALTQEVHVSPTVMDDLLYTIPGEYALFMAGKIFHTPERRSNDKALRSAILLSSVDDRRISILEFLRNYPTREFYIDGDRLKTTAQDMTQLINTVETEFKGPLAVVTDLFKGVICRCEQPAGPDSPINAN